MVYHAPAPPCSPKLSEVQVCDLFASQWCAAATAAEPPSASEQPLARLSARGHGPATLWELGAGSATQTTIDLATSQSVPSTTNAAMAELVPMTRSLSSPDTKRSAGLAEKSPCLCMLQAESDCRAGPGSAAETEQSRCSRAIANRQRPCLNSRWQHMTACGGSVEGCVDVGAWARDDNLDMGRMFV